MNRKDSVMLQDVNAKLTPQQLAEALYEGTPHLQNLAEKLARQHGSVEALTFFAMMPSYIQNFWIDIAKQIIDHSAEYTKEGLSPKELARLKALELNS
jgi:hypothetical protein